MIGSGEAEACGLISESLFESWHQAVGEGEQFDRVNGGDCGLLFHLHATGAAVGGSCHCVDGLHGANDVTADAERCAEVFSGQTEGSGHSSAAFFKLGDLQLRDQSEQLRHGSFARECPDVTGCMPGNFHGQWCKVLLQQAATVQIEQEAAGVLSLSSDNLSFFGADQGRVFACQAEGGGGFCAEVG